MPKRSAADTELTRQAILTGAANVFTREGYGKASLSTIAREADVTKSLIHHHFGSKAALWGAVRDTAFERFAEHQAQMFSSADPDPSVIREGLRAYFRFLQENPIFLKLMRWTEAGDGATDERYRRGLQAVVGQGVAWVRRAQEAGVLRDDLDPGHVFVACTAMLRQWFVSRDWIASSDDDAYLDAAIAIAVGGVLK